MAEHLLDLPHIIARSPDLTYRHSININSTHIRTFLKPILIFILSLYGYIDSRFIINNPYCDRIKWFTAKVNDKYQYGYQ